jgi:hypothetical protein
MWRLAKKMHLQAARNLLSMCLMSVIDPLDKHNKYWKPCGQGLLSSGDSLGKAQIKMMPIGCRF